MASRRLLRGHGWAMSDALVKTANDSADLLGCRRCADYCRSILGLALWQALNPQRSPYFPPPSAWWDSVRVMTQNGKLAPALGLDTGDLPLAIAIAGIMWRRAWHLDRPFAAARRALGPLFEFAGVCRRR